MTIGGFDFEPGQYVTIHTLGMNRDFRRFEDPAKFDIDRKNGRTHVAFMPAPVRHWRARKGGSLSSGC